MRPEDIDKLFKERLGNSSPTPPGDLWNRLQERMEEEAPQKRILLPQREEKRNFMWVYSSVAATVSLILTAGVVFFNIQEGTPEVTEALADKSRVEVKETPVYSQPAPESIAQAEISAKLTEDEKIVTPQATDANSPASNKAEEDVKKEAIAVATPKAVQRKQVKAIAPTQPQATVQQAIAASTPAETVEAAEPVNEPAVKPVLTTALAAAKADANLNAEPVEIIIKRAVASQTQPALAAVDEEQNGLDKKAKLAKNIFKQVRNLASGENVELSELGINADKVALNTQIGKQKFSKVINL